MFFAMYRNLFYFFGRLSLSPHFYSYGIVFVMRIRQFFYNLLYYTLGILGALVIALCLRLFAVDFFVVPSDSMRPSIEPGDFILVDKLSFGARMYRNFDFLKDKTEPETWRVKGFTGIQHNDVVVFNFPYTKGWGKIRMNLSRFYVKRCIGLPGDSLAIRNGYYEVNGRQGFGNMEDQQKIAGYQGDFPKGIYSTIPFDKQLDWNIQNMGPLYVPERGTEIQLDTINIKLYKKLIVYESKGQLKVKNNRVYHDDTLVTSYCFRTNWYFMSGDHIWNSQDSRYIGLIPEEFIVGKARLVLTAKDPDTQTYRWRRFFTWIR